MLKSEVLTEFSQEIINLHNTVNNEKKAHIILNINVDEKSYYDILKFLSEKYEFSYPEEKLIILSKKVKKIVDDKIKFTDWNLRDEIKAELKAELIILLAENGYPPISHDEVYKEIFEQAENYSKSSNIVV